MKFKAGPTAFSYPKGPLIIYHREGGVGGFCHVILLNHPKGSVVFYWILQSIHPPQKKKKKKKKGKPFPGEKLKRVTNVNE